MSNAEQRRFPRIPFLQTGEIEIRSKDFDKVRVPISIRTVSCEGVGLHVTQSSAIGIKRGTSVTLHFVAGDSRLEIPGRVAWATEERDVGIKLQLALAGAATRHAYAAWIVDTTKRAVG